MRYCFILLAGALLTQCSPEAPNHFSDNTLRLLADLQDRRHTDSLVVFLHDEQARYRTHAALALASVQDTLAVPALINGLHDNDMQVRKAAAFALGQTGTARAAEALLTSWSAETDTATQHEMLEAIGKSITRSQRPTLQVSQLPSSKGTAWLLYRMALRGMADSMMIEKASMLLTNPVMETRLGAAHFFARSSAAIDRAFAPLAQSALQEEDPTVRMAATLALRKIKTSQARILLTGIVHNDTDYRVRINAVRALQQFPADSVLSTLTQVLHDSVGQVQVATSEAILALANEKHLSQLLTLAEEAQHWRVRGNLWEAILRVANNQELTARVIKLYDHEPHVYAQASLLTALGSSPQAMDFIHQQLMHTTVPVIRSTAATALVSINRHPSFTGALQKTLAHYYQEAMTTKDAAVIGTIAAALADSTLGYKKIYSETGFLYEAKKLLSLPRDNEALQPLESAIAYFEGKKVSTPVSNQFNHPIDWKLVQSLQRDATAVIETAKGTIRLRLLVEEAPGSVANFVTLARSGYFDKKNFHRVVPNFVIQGGCNRGDGWGSEDYSIRSEFSARRYTTGSVGMASAGKDTEGTQWFITHSPTPHLDGRYTIFAVATAGMEVVDAMEVGDEILSVTIEN